MSRPPLLLAALTLVLAGCGPAEAGEGSPDAEGSALAGPAGPLQRRDSGAAGEQAGASIALVAPATGQALRGIVVLRADSRGPRVRWVDFLVDGAVAGSVSMEPFAFALDVSRLAPGEHRFEAVAWSEDFARHVSAPVLARSSAAPPAGLRVSTTAGLLEALRTLGPRGGAVSLAPGVYALDAPLEIGPRVFLSGAGRGLTVLRAGSSGWDRALLRLTGSETTVRSLSIDYADGRWNAIELSAPRIARVVLQDLEVRGLSAARSGIELWGSEHRGISVQDCVLSGGAPAAGAEGAPAEAGGAAGLRDSAYDDTSGETSAFRNRVSGFRELGIAFPAWADGKPKPGRRNLAVGNEIEDIGQGGRSEGRSEAALWLGGQDNAAFHNTLSRAGWELIWLGSNCFRCTIEDNSLTGARTGIYLEHSADDALIRGNRIDAVDTGVNVEWSYGGGGTRRARLTDNAISARLAGVSLDGGSDGFLLERNRIRAGLVAVRLSGVKGTTVRDNDLRGAQRWCIEERATASDRGGQLAADSNELLANDCRGSIEGLIDRDATSGAHDTVAGNRWP